MANNTSTGTVRYPLPTRQETTVSVPVMDAGKWEAPTYAETPEYAPLQRNWQMAGIQGAKFGPVTHNTITRGPSDFENRMQRIALEKAQMDLEDAAKARQPLPSAMRMTNAGRWGMYVDPSQLSQAQQQAGLVGGMYGSPSGGDWAGRMSMFGGLQSAPVSGPGFGGLSDLAAQREGIAARNAAMSRINPNEITAAMIAQREAAQQKK